MRSGKLTNEEKEGIIRCIHIWLLVFGFVLDFRARASLDVRCCCWSVMCIRNCLFPKGKKEDIIII